MNIDKKFLMDLIKSGKGENSYLLNLYKIYELCRKISNGNLKRNKDLLDEVEDKIYTINGKVLSQQERIALEIKRVYKVCSGIKDEKIKNAFINQLKDIVGIIDFNFDDPKFKSEFNQDELYYIAKQTLSVAQAKLDMPISFLYSASTVFMDIYESEFLNSQQFLGDLLNYAEQLKDSIYNNDKKILYNYDIYNKKSDGGK